MKKILSLMSIVILSYSLMAGAVVKLSDTDMINLTQSELKIDDVIITVRAPVDIKPGRLTPKISYEIRKLRRSDTIIYDSDKDGSPTTSCLIIMIVPIENADEIIKRIDADPTLTLITEQMELTEETKFPELTTIKDEYETFITSEGK